jgi:hypothetical protein
VAAVAGRQAHDQQPGPAAWQAGRQQAGCSADLDLQPGIDRQTELDLQPIWAYFHERDSVCKPADFEDSTAGAASWLSVL